MSVARKPNKNGNASVPTIASLFRPRQEPFNMVHKTDDYGMFSFDPRNRPIDPKHLAELIEAIKRRNRLAYSPILVDKNHCVLDGQHRLKAAESLGLYIFYQVADDVGFNEVGEINSLSKNWGWEDYLHYYAASDCLDYVKLKHVYEQHTFLVNLPAAAGMFTRKDKKNLKGVFSRGGYAFNDELCSNTLSTLSDFGQFQRLKSLMHLATFQTAVNQLVRNPHYDHKRMMNKLELHSRRFERCSTQMQYVEQFEDIYNFKHKEDTKVKFTK